MTTAIIRSNKLSIPIQISDTEEKKIVKTLGLIDSGAGGKFIDQNYVQSAGFKTHALETPLRAYNVDRTKKKQGTIKTYVKLDLEINGRKIPYEIICNWVRKGTDHFGIPLVDRGESRYQLETGKFS